MGKLILRISVSIDGYLESSAGKLDFNKSRSPEGMALVAEKMARAGAHLLGRKAFTEMSTFWPTASGPSAQAMNGIPKIVFSKKGFDPAQVTGAKGWADAKVVAGDLAEGIAKLKAQSDKDLMAHGGIEFVRNLVATGLIDEYCIATHPVAAGGGMGLFGKLEKPLYLKLVESKAFSTGAMLNTYRPE